MDPQKPTNHPTRRLAAAICFGEALVMAGFAGFYLVELFVGDVDDRMRVLTAGILILVFAVGAAALGRLWLGRSRWPVTPTVVWHALLVPVAIGMFQSGQPLIGAVLSLTIVAAVAAAIVSAREPEPTDPAGGSAPS